MGDAEQRDPRWQKFLDHLHSKSFFKGCEEGSREYHHRLATARAKFNQKYGAAPAPAEAAPSASQEPTAVAAATPVAAAAAPSAGPVSEERRREACEMKTLGNQKLAMNELDEAVECYTKAIELDPNEVPSST